MSGLVNGSTLVTYGGALKDYSPVVDPTVDRPAAGANVAFADTDGMTRCAVRAWIRFTVNGTNTPVLVSHNAWWGNAVGVAPVPTRTGAGVYVVTWGANQQDDIPIGLPGYVGPQAINFQAGWPNLRVVATAFDLFVTITSPNVATIKCFNTGGSLADPGVATDIDVFLI